MTQDTNRISDYERVVETLDNAIEDLKAKGLSFELLEKAAADLRRHSENVRALEGSIQAVREEVIDKIRDRLDENKSAAKFSRLGFIVGAVGLIASVLSSLWVVLNAADVSILPEGRIATTQALLRERLVRGNQPVGEYWHIVDLLNRLKPTHRQELTGAGTIERYRQSMFLIPQEQLFIKHLVFANVETLDESLDIRVRSASAKTSANVSVAALFTPADGAESFLLEPKRFDDVPNLENSKARGFSVPGRSNGTVHVITVYRRPLDDCEFDFWVVRPFSIEGRVQLATGGIDVEFRASGIESMSRPLSLEFKREGKASFTSDDPYGFFLAGLCEDDETACPPTKNLDEGQNTQKELSKVLKELIARLQDDTTPEDLKRHRPAIEHARAVLGQAGELSRYQRTLSIAGSYLYVYRHAGGKLSCSWASR